MTFITAELAASLLSPRDRAAHKGTVGRVLAVAGSPGLTGAACMASTAALRVGCGVVTLAAANSLMNILGVKLTEVMTKSLPEDAPGILGAAAVAPVLELAADYDALLIGPGLGRAAATVAFVRRVVEAVKKPLLIDADGLFALRGATDILPRREQPAVLTPHLGELAGLLDISVAELRRDIAGHAKRAAGEWQAVIVAKSEATIVAYPDGRVFQTTVGNPGMATAGCGDVLAGTIAGLCVEAGGDAPIVGTYLHGLAGDLAYQRRGVGLIATDIIAKLPKARLKISSPPAG